MKLKITLVAAPILALLFAAVAVAKTDSGAAASAALGSTCGEAFVSVAGALSSAAAAGASAPAAAQRLRPPAGAGRRGGSSATTGRRVCG